LVVGLERGKFLGCGERAWWNEVWMGRLELMGLLLPVLRGLWLLFIAYGRLWALRLLQWFRWLWVTVLLGCWVVSPVAPEVDQ
jgi:hypothetical protein